MEAVDRYCNSLEPLFDGVPIYIVELTAQILLSEPSQMAASIDEKFSVGNTCFLVNRCTNADLRNRKFLMCERKLPLSLTPRDRSRSGCRHPLQAGVYEF